MATSKLQLKLLSSSGELLNVVNATAGRLTVLRSFVPSQLEPYKRAISGVPGPEKIVITIDGQEFNPENHILIGFGENVRSIGHSVSEHLLQAGVNENAIPGILMSYGLTDVAQQPFTKLSSCEAQRCRLLAAMQQSKKLVLLNNPFEPLSSEWRERFADLLILYVRNTPLPVLITSMTYRPESFINNEMINRVQVGETDQRTIGFGSAPSEYDDLIKQIRSGAHEAPQKAITTPTPKATRDATSARKSSSQSSSQKVRKKKSSESSSYGISHLLHHRSVKKVGGLLVASCLVLALVLNVREDDLARDGGQTSKPAVVEAPKVTKIARTQESSEPDDNHINPPNNKAVEVAKPEQVTKPKPTPVRQQVKADSPYTLDLYRSSIRESILSSFEGTESARAANLQLASLSNQRRSSEKTTNDRQEKTDAFTESLLKDLQKTDGSGKHLPDRKPQSSYTTRYPDPNRSSATSGTSPSDFQQMSKEERRALLREKFRLAIERAAKNK